MDKNKYDFIVLWDREEWNMESGLRPYEELRLFDDKDKYLALIASMYKEELIDILDLSKDENVETEKDDTNWDITKGNTGFRDVKTGKSKRCPESRYWFCTFWEEHTDYHTLKMLFKKDGHSGIICKEYCKDGKVHFHLYVAFPLGDKFRITEKLHGYGITKGKTLVSGKGAMAKAVEYCRKDGNWESWGNLDFPLYKVGPNTIPLKNM